MFEVGVYEAKTKLSEIIRRVQKGEECVITVRGKPAVNIRAAERDKKTVAEAWREIRAYSKKHPVKATLEEILAWKNEGRR